jgi:hypothetical protein
MRSTSNNCMGVLGGIPPLAERIAYLNIGYVVAAFNRLGHHLGERLGAKSVGGAEHESLHQRIFRCFIIGYSSIRVLSVA